MSSGSIRKSILTSTTFWSVILLLFQAVGPSVDQIIRTNVVTYADVWSIMQACVTALVGVVARYNAGGLYTPKGAPGLDPPTRRGRAGLLEGDDLHRR
jgi:hypothetical protein